MQLDTHQVKSVSMWTKRIREMANVDVLPSPLII